MTQSKLSRGVSVASIPPEILNLFSSPKAITDYGAKKLLEILASDGLSVMLARANHYAESVNDKSTRMVLAALGAVSLSDLKHRSGCRQSRSGPNSVSRLT